MIRPATLKDVPSICFLGRESLEINDPYPTLRICDDKIKQTAIEVVSSAAHFAWVNEDNEGNVNSAVCAYTSEIMFHERKQCSLLLYYSRNKGYGNGGRLLRELVTWWRGRPGIKMLTITLEEGTDQKVGCFLENLGLNKKLPVYVGL